MTELIPVSNGTEYLEVHPSTFAAHKRAGWLECDRRDEEPEVETVKSATVAELRSALAAKGIPIPEGARKGELKALLADSE